MENKNELPLKIVANSIEKFQKLSDVAKCLNVEFLKQFKTMEEHVGISFENDVFYDNKPMRVIGSIRSVKESKETVKKLNSNYKEISITSDIIIGEKKEYIRMTFFIQEDKQISIECWTEGYTIKP